MLIIDNINKTVKEDLQAGIQKGSKMSVAAACFSIYAYQELKKQLEGIEELRFIFTSPTFITEKASKAQREFYIPRISRERSLYGTEFEVKLRNELTQKAIAKECADWIRHKVVFKSNVTQEQMMGFMTVDESTYMPINGFTTVDLGCERGNNAYYPVQKTESFENANYFLKLFEQLWNDKKKLQEVTDVVIENISAAYRENAPEYIYFVALYNIFKEFLDDISEDELPNEATGFKESKIWGMLYNFQRDAVLAIISKLEKFNGCILADSVGLGKTFTALAVIKYYENRNKSVLVLCPKKLSENWNTYKGNYVNNPIATDRLRYDVLYHTDLSREHGQSNGIDLDRLNWGNYDLVVIDESHNFRNGGEVSGEDAKENRYLKLLNKVVRAGVKTKVLMLSATPVNNKFIDLKNQLALAYEGDASQMNKKLETTKSIDEIFRQAQKSFNTWSKLPADERTTDELLRTLDFDFFELLDSVTIARSRKHIEKYYNTSDIGKFPERLPPISLRPCLTDLSDAINYNDMRSVQFSYAQTATQQFNKLFDGKRIFENPKNTADIKKLLAYITSDEADGIILDFFSGSATTAHAVMQLNAEDGGHRKFIMVQLPEPCDKKSEAYKAGYKNICEIGKERIRRAGEKIQEARLEAIALSKHEWDQTCYYVEHQEECDRLGHLPDEYFEKEHPPIDTGFRVLKLDDTNMKDVYYAPDDYDQGMIAGLESNIKDDRTDLDLLFGCLIDWGLPLSLPYKSEQLGGCTVHTYNDGDLIACFDANIPESVVKEIAQRRPLRAVFRDSGFASSPEKINVFEIFKLYMPEDANDISKRVRVI